MNPWHLPADVLTQYASSPESVDHPTASSVEMHLVECADCRATLAAATVDELVERSWTEIVDRIDAPPPRIAHRWLRAVGFDDVHARLVAATPALRLSAIAGVFVIVVGLLALSIAIDDPGPFLVFAPALPLAAVAAAFWPGADPAGEAGRATPLAGLALVLRRTVVLLVPCLVLMAIASLAVPGAGWTDAGWVLPSLALAGSALALSTWLRAEVATAAVAGTWFGALFIASSRQHADVPDLAPLRPAAQAAWLGVVVVTLAVSAIRRDAFEIPSEVR